MLLQQIVHRSADPSQCSVYRLLQKPIGALAKVEKFSQRLDIASERNYPPLQHGSGLSTIRYV
jgi:hypothetical protein